MDIPNLRDKAEREKWRNDTACTDKKVAGDMLLPVFSKGTPEIDKSVYDRIRDKWDEMNRNAGGNYRVQELNPKNKK